MTGPQIQQAAQGFSRWMVTIGGVILIVCVGLLTYTWWLDGRWGWVILGVALIVVNVVMIAMTFRKARLTPPPPPDDED